MDRRPLLINGGRVVDPASGIDGPRDILIRNGRVAAVARNIRLGRGVQAHVTDAKGLWVLPGLIDLHVHLREPGRTEDEPSCSRAAVRGHHLRPNTVPATTPRARAV